MGWEDTNEICHNGVMLTYESDKKKKCMVEWEPRI